ncbi:MAG: CAP domain-containing protein [Phycisphaeraceae bacterium]|nr:CAP domain-containing protein [Phycisphaeraceae bacterium]
MFDRSRHRGILGRASRPDTRRRAPRHDLPCFDALEPRTLLSFSWTAQEVYLAELVNRARANPLAEGTRLGINLAAGLTSAEQARLVPQQPLALNQYLTIAARAHGLDMAARNFFDHINPSGLNPTQRAQAAGYVGSAGENIAAGYASIDAAHKAWLESVGHRKNVLSLWSNFDNSFHYDEFGPGIGMGIGGAYNNYYVQKFGVRAGNTAFILGVVYDDTSGDNFYTIGEGRAGVRIDVASAASPNVTIATYTTTAAGNYQFDLPQGSYTLRFTEESTGRILTRTVNLGAWNTKIDGLLAQFTTPVIADDHADAGDWTDATLIPVSPTVGDGAAGGAINFAGDTDLFRFVAAGAGQTTILLGGGAGWTRTLRVYDSAGILLGTASESSPGQYAQVTFTATQGAAYFLLVSAEGAGAGAYALVVDGQSPQSQHPGPGVIDDTHRPADAVKANIGLGADGRVVMTYLNAFGKPTFAAQNSDGSWSITDLSTVFNAASFTGEVVHYTDVNTGDQMAAVRANLGIVLYRLVNGSHWIGMNVVKRTAGSTNIGTELSLVFDKNGLVTITGLTKQGKVVLWQQLKNNLPNGNPRFYFRNVSDRDLAPLGLAARFESGLTTWTTPRGTMNMAAVDPQGRIRMFWRVNNTEWTGIILSDFVNMPAAITGDITAFQTPGRGITIIGNDASGGTHTIRWRANSGWIYRGITDVGGNTLLQAGGLSSFIMPGAPAYVAGIDLDGNLTLYRYRYGNDTWNRASVNIPDAPVLSAYASTYFDESTGQTYIVSRSIGGEFQLLAIDQFGSWSTHNLSALLAA